MFFEGVPNFTGILDTTVEFPDGNSREIVFTLEVDFDTLSFGYQHNASDVVPVCPNDTFLSALRRPETNTGRFDSLDGTAWIDFGTSVEDEITVGYDDLSFVFNFGFTGIRRIPQPSTVSPRGADLQFYNVNKLNIFGEVRPALSKHHNSQVQLMCTLFRT